MRADVKKITFLERDCPNYYYVLRTSNIMSKILITGAAGFIGSQLAYYLWKKKHNLTLIDNYSFGQKDNLIFDDVSFLDKVKCIDITDMAEMEELFKNNLFDYVYHIAGIAPLPDCQSNPYLACSVNIGGTINVLECSRKYGVKNVIFASTSAIYENDTQFPSIEDRVIPPTLIYPSTKYCAEQFCKSYYETYGLNVSIMRFANVYGPHIDCLRKQPPFIAYVIRELFYDRSPILHSNGEQSRDYIYVDDLLDLAYILLENKGFDVINVSSNESYSVNQLYDMIAELMGSNRKASFIDSVNYWKKYPQLYEGALKINPSILDSEVNKYTLCDNSHGKTKYGWIPKTSLKEGLKETIKYTTKMLSTIE